MSFQNYCLRVFSNVNPESTFLSIIEYQNNFSEVSNFSVCFNIDYLNAIKKSFKIIENTKLKNLDLLDKSYSLEDLSSARDELLDSYKNTLNGFNPKYTCNDTYSEVLGTNGLPIKGLKLHTNQDVLHINAIKIRKTILVPGDYKIPNSSTQTIAKKFLKSLTPLKGFVQFKLVPEKFKTLKVQKMIIDGGYRWI